MGRTASRAQRAGAALRSTVGNHGLVPAQPTTQPAGARQPRLILRAPPANRLAALLLAGSMLALWTWWALASGAFFGTVLLPGAIVLYLVLIITVGLARLPISPRGPHAVALAALLALALWTALSLLWTPARELAFDYAQRSFVYAAAFAAGLAFTIALRQRLVLSLAPWLIAGAIVVAVAVIKVWTAAEIESVVDIDGTLDYPFGYRNANAGFFAMLAFGFMPVIGRARSGVALRSAAAAAAAASLSLAAVSQSRGSLLGVAAGVIVLMAVSPRRGRALLALLVVAIPITAVIGELLDPFEAADTGSALGELQQAMRAALGAGALAGVLSAVAALLERLLERPLARLPRPRPARRTKLLAGVALVAAGALAFSLAVGNPISMVSSQIDRISSGGVGYTEIEGSRFTYTGGLNRVNFWEVALNQVEESPLLGGGAGSFRSAYLVEGNGLEEPRNAHSLPLEMLGELGIVGLALLCLALGAAIFAAWRSRRLGPESATVSTVALVVAAVALAQAAVDWSWFFGGQMAPVMALLGSAAAPAALALRPLGRGIRGGVVVAAVLLAAVAAPSFVSERLTLEAARSWRSDVDGAYGALGTAADLNPFANTPLLVEAEIARSTDNSERALAALAEAQSRAPDDWRKYMLAAQTLERIDPAAASRQAEIARSLNPSSREVRGLQRRLAKAGEPSG